MSKTSKKITLKLAGLNGNSFFLMGKFQSQARREGWTQKEINEVLDDAVSKDYEHLLYVLMEHCQDPEETE